MTRKICCALLFCFFVIGCSSSNERTGQSPSSSEKDAPFNLKGRIVFQSNMDGDNEIYTIDKNGLKKMTDNTWDDRFPTWSPDGKKIAYYANPSGNDDIFIMDFATRIPIQITHDPADETDPAWFPDGESIVFAKEKKNILKKNGALYRMHLKSGQTRRLIPELSKTHGIPHVSPKNDFIAFTVKRIMGWDVAVYDLMNQHMSVLGEQGKTCRARFSRDGKRLIYVSSIADGKGDIWIMNPDGTAKTRVTKRDDTYDYFPSWSPDDRYIVFCSSHQHDHEGDWRLYVVDSQTGDISFLYDSKGSDIFPDWTRD